MDGVTAPSREPRATSPVGSAWRRVVLRNALLPALVMLPLLSVAPRADNRFNIYRFGGEYVAEPWRIVTDQVARIPLYLEGSGNFRPLGRMVERTLDVGTYLLGTSLQIPAGAAMRAVHVLAVAVLAVTLTVFAATVTTPDRVLQAPPSPAAALVGPALALSLVAAGNASAMMVFTDLYSLSAALVLAVALGASRRPWLDERGPGVASAVLALAVGAAVAAFNEIAALAVPVAAVAVAVRGRLVLRLPWRALLTSRAASVVALGTVGFLAVTVPVRTVIARTCAEGGCYAASEIAVGSELGPALAHRLLSAVPGPAWWVAWPSEVGPWDWTRNPVTWLLLLGAAVVVHRAVRDANAADGLPLRGCAALATSGAAIVLGAAGLAASSASVQALAAGDWRVGAGWRETPLAAAGVALVVVAGLTLVVGRRPPAHLDEEQPSEPTWPGGRDPSAATLGGLTTLALTLGVAASLLVNQAVAVADGTLPEAILADRIALALVDTPLTDDGDRERCELLATFRELDPDRPRHHERLEAALDAAMQAQHARAFCEGRASP